MYYNMGAIYSLFAYNWYGNNQSFLQMRGLFVSLGMTSYEISKLYHAFRRIDKDRSGTIQLLELLNHLDIERTSFSEKVFGMFDIDGSGAIDFAEFAVGLWVYCTLDKETLALFTFDLYDHDHSGVMQSNEVIELLQDLYGKNYLTNKVSQKMQKLEMFSCPRDAFIVFTKQHPALLFPAFELQLCIISKCLGFQFWSNASRSRREMVEEHKSDMSISKVRHIMSHRKRFEAPLINPQRCRMKQVNPECYAAIPNSTLFMSGNDAMISREYSIDDISQHVPFDTTYEPPSLTVDVSLPCGDVIMDQLQSETLHGRQRQKSRRTKMKKRNSSPLSKSKASCRRSPLHHKIGVLHQNN